ncbi:MAG: hypothetical protein ACYCQL_00625 [Acidithiobacillus sp.]
MEELDPEQIELLTEKGEPYEWVRNFQKRLAHILDVGMQTDTPWCLAIH